MQKVIKNILPPSLLYINDMKYPNVLGYESSSFIINDSILSRYIDILLNRNSRNICKFDIDTEEYYIDIDVFKTSYRVSDLLRIALDKCRKLEKKKRFYLLPIALRFPTRIEDNLNSYISGHFNVIVIDNLYQTIEFFEPHGEIYNGGHLVDTEKVIKYVINEMLPEISDYVFTNSSNVCLKGFQKNDRYCVAWGLLFIELRLLNPSFLSQDIINIFSNFLSMEPSYIEKYITFIYSQVSYLPEKKSSLKKNIYNLSIDNIINPSDIELRIKSLVYSLKKIQYNINQYNIQYSLESILDVNDIIINNLKNSRKIIFNELVQYKEYNNFFNNFFA